MKTHIKKIGAAILAALFSLSFSACGRTAGSDKTNTGNGSGFALKDKMPNELPEGISWYDFKEDKGIFDYLSDTIGGFFMEDITWFNGQYWLFLCETEPKLPVYHIMSFDENDKVTNDFVIRNEFGDSISLCRMLLGSRLYLTAYDFSTQKDYLYPVDEKDGSVSPDNKIDLTKNLPANESFHSCAFVGDDLAILPNSDHPRVELIDPAGGTLKKQVSLEALSRDYNIEYPEGILCAGKDKVAVWGYTSVNTYFGQLRYCLVDLESGKICALDEMEYIDIPLRNLAYNNGCLVSVTDSGVYIIDTENGTCRQSMSFDYSNCNRYLVNNSELAYADEDKLIFGYTSRNAGIGQIPYAVCSFSRTSGYPAAGKNILTIASTEDLDYSISEAIVRFNSESDTSYMIFDDRYKANQSIDYSNTGDADRASVNALNSYASVSDRLAMDLLAGEGPDILITNGSNEMLSRSDYFIDLSDYLENEKGIDESGYFMNAINASRYNGALYQFPIGFYVEGFLGTSDSLNGKNGLTFEEYSDLVKTVCNGKDPFHDHQLSYSRASVAAKLFANSSELFIKDGKIDVNREEFKAILDYCRDLPVKGYYEDKDLDLEYEDQMSAKESMPVQPMIVDNFFYFEMFAMKQGDVSICGYPSTDGRTASVGSNLAVSVSAQSEDQSACRKFLSILLSDEIQQTISINIPVNKKCARDQFITEIQDVNKSVEKNAGNIFAAPGRKLDPSLADRYIDQLSLASTSSFVYHSISLIIYEEIPAYLEGQKSFEEVAAAINDRAQKVLDERD